MVQRVFASTGRRGYPPANQKMTATKNYYIAEKRFVRMCRRFGLLLGFRHFIFANITSGDRPEPDGKNQN